MLIWLSAHIGTILVAAGLLALVGMIVAGMIRDHKAGRSSCGCGCKNCAMSGSCHKKE